MKTAARVFLAAALLAAIGLLIVGLWTLGEQRGVWAALAVFPGIPLGAALLFVAAQFAVGDDS